jgi:hypothetical protein
MFCLGCQDVVNDVAEAAMKATTAYITALANVPEVMELVQVITPIMNVLQGCLQRGDEEVVQEGLEVIQECFMMEQPLINDHIEVWQRRH